METDYTTELRRITNGKRWNGFFVNAVASNGVEFADAVRSLDEAKAIVEDLQRGDEVTKLTFSDIEVWDKDCSEIVMRG